MNFMKIGTNNAHYFLMKNTIDIKSHIESLAKKSLIGNHGEIFAKIYKENPFLLKIGTKSLDTQKIFYPLCQSSWGFEEKEAILNQVDSGHFTMGKMVGLFEKKFANYFNSKYAVMVNSGSSANLVIVAALTLSPKYDLNKGDEVIVPSLGWSTSYAPFFQYGLKLRFVDINKFTFNIDEQKIENAITSKTKAILGINILGNPIEFSKIKKICKKHNLILIEDNCESLGAKYKSKYAGTIGVAGSHSFYFSHHIQTIEGGMITTDDPEIYEYIKSLRAHGWTRELSNGSELKNFTGDSFHDCFRFVLPGYNLRPNELNGAIGLCQLKKFDTFMETRIKNSETFKDLFGNQPFCQIQKCSKDSSWFGFSIILDGNLKNKRSHVLYELQRYGIETRPIVTGNFLKNPVIKFYDYSISQDLKNAQTIDHRGFFVGNYNKLLTNELEKLHSILNKLDKFYSKKKLKIKI